MTQVMRIQWKMPLVALVFFAFAAANPIAGAKDNSTEAAHGNKVLKFDVAENGSKFVFDETPVHPDGLPAYGGEFITQGYLYPEGTISCTSGSCNGVNADGTPEFPNLVIGTWTCYGYHVGDGAHTVTGPWVITTQMYDIGSTPGSESVMTQGFELVDLDTEFQRAITGGTGKYRRARGEQKQIFRGFNPSVGVALQVELRMKN